MLNRFKECRLKAGFGQKYVAQMLGVSSQTISYWESDQRTPTTDKLVQLASLYDVSTDYLLGLTSDPHGRQEVHVEKYRPTDEELMRIPEIAMMAREMGDMTESQRQQMLAIGKALVKEYFNVDGETK